MISTLRHSKVVSSLIPGFTPFGAEFVYSPHVCVGFFQVFWFPPMVQTHADSVKLLLDEETRQLTERRS